MDIGQWTCAWIQPEAGWTLWFNWEEIRSSSSELSHWASLYMYMYSLRMPVIHIFFSYCAAGVVQTLFVLLIQSYYLELELELADVHEFKDNLFSLLLPPSPLFFLVLS